MRSYSKNYQELLDHSQNEQALIEQERAAHQQCVQLAEQNFNEAQASREKISGTSYSAN